MRVLLFNFKDTRHLASRWHYTYMEVLSVVYITKAAGLQLLLLSYHRMYFSEQRPVAREGEREGGGVRERARDLTSSPSSSLSLDQQPSLLLNKTVLTNVLMKKV